MSYSVTIKNGLADVALPGGTIAQGGQTYTLTDDQYLSLSPTAAAALFSSSSQTGGGGGGDMLSTNNLSDVASVPTSRTSLGLGGAAVLNVGTTTGTVAAGDAVGTAVQTLWTPASQGLKGWTFDPVMVSSSGVAPTAGVVSLGAIQLYSAFTSTNFYWSVATAGATLTAGQNFVGLYNSAGNLVWSTSADTTATTTGLKTETMAVALTAGKYWGAAVFNGTTVPGLARCGAVAGSTAAINLGLTGAALRSATNGATQTALPNPITLSSNAAGSFFWFAIK